MKFKIFITALLLMSISLSAQQFLGVVSYSMGLGTGNTGDFISDYSFKGFQFEGRSFTNRNWTFGGTFGWNIFDEQINELVHLENGEAVSDVQGTQVRYVNSFPIMANGHYYFFKRKDPVRPFIGMNVGLYYISQRFQMGIYEVNESNWHFGFAPEVGFLIPVGSVAIIANAKYNYALSAGQPLGRGTDNSQSYISVNIGLAFYSY
jgi:outer membrane protein W